MVGFVLCEPLPQPLEFSECDGGNVCSCMVKYGRFRSFDLDSGLSDMNVFVWVAFFNI